LKVFVFADDNVIVPAGVFPNLGVTCVAHVEIENMLAVHAAGSQKAGERSRQLVIDQKLHNA